MTTNRACSRWRTIRSAAIFAMHSSAQAGSCHTPSRAPAVSLRAQRSGLRSAFVVVTPWPGRLQVSEFQLQLAPQLGARSARHPLRCVASAVGNTTAAKKRRRTKTVTNPKGFSFIVGSDRRVYREAMRTGCSEENPNAQDNRLSWPRRGHSLCVSCRDRSDRPVSDSRGQRARRHSPDGVAQEPDAASG
jgi:hypothetical protein